MKREEAQEKVKRFLHVNFPEEMSKEDKEHMEKGKGQMLRSEQSIRTTRSMRRLKVRKQTFIPVSKIMTSCATAGTTSARSLRPSSTATI